MAQELVDLQGCDFIDFGAREGGSLRMASAAFGGTGLGVDINPQNIKIIESKGHRALLADATKLPLADNAVKFSVAFDFLEHLPNRKVGEAVIESAVRVSQDFFLAVGPDFSGQNYLKDLGLKKYFADWGGHTWHHTALELKSILAKYERHKCMLIQFERIYDSNSPVLHPIGASPGQHRFDPTGAASKPAHIFKPKIFERLAFVILKTDRFSPEELLFRAMKPKMAATNVMTPLYERP